MPPYWSESGRTLETGTVVVGKTECRTCANGAASRSNGCTVACDKLSTDTVIGSCTVDIGLHQPSAADLAVLDGVVNLFDGRFLKVENVRLSRSGRLRESDSRASAGTGSQPPALWLEPPGIACDDRWRHWCSAGTCGMPSSANGADSPDAGKPGRIGLEDGVTQRVDSSVVAPRSRKNDRTVEADASTYTAWMTWISRCAK